MEKIDVKHKGNMIQNENREYEAATPDSTIVNNENVKKSENNKMSQPRNNDKVVVNTYEFKYWQFKSIPDLDKYKLYHL